MAKDTYKKPRSASIRPRKSIDGLEYLAKVSKILSSSLDYTKTLTNTVQILVPEIADWCSISMLNPDNSIEQLAIAHIDPKKVKWAKKLNRQNPETLEDAGGMANVLRNGTSEIYPVVTDDMLVASAKDEQQLKLLRKLNLTSVMLIPLTVQHKTIGGISFISTSADHHYTHADVALAEEIASRAALAIHNSFLFTESQKALTLRDEFISIASHELKTPITSLKMYGQIVHQQLMEQGIDTSILSSLTKMNGQVDRLTMLVNDMLNVSKIQLGKLEFNEDNFNLQKMVNDTVEIVQSNAPKHHIVIEGNITKSVWGDKDRISQVLINLLTNAIKYSPHEYKIKVTLSEKKRGVAEVKVQDYGIGIDKEQQAKIFTRFYRVSGPDEKTFPGLGIGLYISSEIIRRHGGTLEVNSVKGKGSTFCFTVPFTKPSRS
jgi:signal transduction histidine kinase